MRAHIVNSLSDEQIRSLHIEAEKQLQAIMESQQKAEEDLWKQHAENSARCKDIAFSTKNPGACKIPFYFPETTWPGYGSVEEIFERNLMGMCNFAKTVNEAKKFGCLP